MCSLRARKNVEASNSETQAGFSDMWNLKLTCHQYLHHHHPINSSIRDTWDLKLTCHQHRHRYLRSFVRRRRHIPIASITNTIATWWHVRCKTHESPASIIRKSFMNCATRLVDSIWFNNTARFHQMLGNGWVLHCRPILMIGILFTDAVPICLWGPGGIIF